MMDCRGTPRRRASLSNCWIIQTGKSTLTRLCSCCGLRALEISRYWETSSPSSNFLSSSLAFIQCSLLFPGTPHRDDADRFTPVRYDSRPYFSFNYSDHQKARFITRFERDFNKIRIVPQQ